MLPHLLQVHLLPVNTFEKLVLLHLWGSACVYDTGEEEKRERDAF